MFMVVLSSNTKLMFISSTPNTRQVIENCASIAFSDIIFDVTSSEKILITTINILSSLYLEEDVHNVIKKCTYFYSTFSNKIIPIILKQYYIS